MNVPDRGDVVVMDFDPQAGREQMKRRLALVLSPPHSMKHSALRSSRR
jgi:mRNA-degrading endonuclease toxin of MazEF toxin-antitoxin module